MLWGTPSTRTRTAFVHLPTSSEMLLIHCLQTHADSLIDSWQSLALSADKTHILTLYGDPQSSWSLSYNLYADRLLGTNLVPSSVSALLSFSAEDPSLICRCKVVANHTKFLGSLLETGALPMHVTHRHEVHSLLAPPFGLPIDTRDGQTTSIGELSMTSMAYAT